MRCVRCSWGQPRRAEEPFRNPAATLRGMTELDLAADVVTLTADLCDRESVSGGEQGLADAIEAALRRLDHLVVTRDGNTVVARTELGRPERVVLAGHTRPGPPPRPAEPPDPPRGGGAPRPRDGRHEGWGRGAAADRRAGHRADPGQHLPSLRRAGSRV